MWVALDIDVKRKGARILAPAAATEVGLLAAVVMLVRVGPVAGAVATAAMYAGRGPRMMVTTMVVWDDPAPADHLICAHPTRGGKTTARAAAVTEVAVPAVVVRPVPADNGRLQMATRTEEGPCRKATTCEDPAPTYQLAGAHPTVADQKRIR